MQVFIQSMRKIKKPLIGFLSVAFLLMGATLIIVGSFALAFNEMVKQQNGVAELASQIPALLLVIIGTTIASVGTMGVVVRVKNNT